MEVFAYVSTQKVIGRKSQFTRGEEQSSPWYKIGEVERSVGSIGLENNPANGDGKRVVRLLGRVRKRRLGDGVRGE